MNIPAEYRANGRLIATCESFYPSYIASEKLDHAELLAKILLFFFYALNHLLRSNGTDIPAVIGCFGCMNKCMPTVS
jgi:hypothetical protein